MIAVLQDKLLCERRVGLGVVLDNRRLINGVAPKVAKKICAMCSWDSQETQEIAAALDVPEEVAMRWLVSLAEAGYLELDVQDRSLLWLCSVKGVTSLVRARIGRPLSGSVFAELLLTVAQRAKEYNLAAEYPLYIDRLYIFGPILNQPWLAEDPSIVVTSSERSTASKTSSWRFSYCADKVQDKHLSIVEQLRYPESEMDRFLKKPKEQIDLFRGDIAELSSERRLIYSREGLEIPQGHCLLTTLEIRQLGESIDRYRKEKPKRRGDAGRISSASIAEHWGSLGVLHDLGIAEDDAKDHCWRCGARQEIRQCHIVPDALGGPYTEANLILLCARCHSEAPNLCDERIMFDWLRSYRERYGKEYWINAAMDEYARIYGKDIHAEVQDVLEHGAYRVKPEEALTKLKLLANAESARATVHFGQSWLNDSTLAGCFRRALEQLPNSLLERRD